MKSLNLYGFASGIAANNPDCGLGPLYLYYHPELWGDLPFEVEWKDLLMATSELRGLDVLPELLEISTLLAEDISQAVSAGEPFCVVGGDHSVGIGSWSGAAHALREKGPLGLIWVDAHMDTHTPDTSPSQNIHGMPISHLLGHGLAPLCELLDKAPKVLPEHLCLIGVRSFEPGEAQLLQDLNVKVYTMEEVTQRGLDVVFAEARDSLFTKIKHFGLTIDLDAFDPTDAPGVGCQEAGGIRSAEFVKVVKGLARYPGFVGMEIAELNPLLDDQAKTAKLIPEIVKAVYAE